MTLTTAEYHDRLDEIIGEIADVWDQSSMSASDVETDMKARLADFVETAKKRQRRNPATHA